MNVRTLPDVLWVRQSLTDGTARALRKSAGLSEANIADMVGVHEATISRWERGQRKPSAAASERLARVLRLIEQGRATA